MDLYTQNIMDHFRRPRHKGRLMQPNVTHAEANYSCGDRLCVDVVIKDGVVCDFAFDGAGCAISQASMSILGDMIKDKSEDDILAMDVETVKKYLGVEISQRRAKCALLGLMTVHNAILKQRGEPTRQWTDYFHL